MTRNTAKALRAQIDATIYANEAASVAKLRETAALSVADRARIGAKGADLVRQIRGNAEPGPDGSLFWPNTGYPPTKASP